MNRTLNLGLAAALGIGMVGIVPQAIAIQLADGTVYFERPPSLIDTSTNRSTASTAGGTYYFTLEVPDNAGEPLKAVAIAPESGNSASQRIRYRTDRTTAFEGTRRSQGETLAIQTTAYDEETQTLTVEFEPAVPPGTTVTLAIRPDRNPLRDGVYLFGVTAYPPGEQAHGQFLGYGRLHFYQPDYWRPFWR
ncbi:MAG: DUF2808 domain-containing protein [Leptolyngbya sp. DLM2.Bin15]|nr:MAG: DUF2808 domain-containing protein [Leptolyngbya sp. DLM2.Bin15]